MPSHLCHVIIKHKDYVLTELLNSIYITVGTYVFHDENFLSDVFIVTVSAPNSCPYIFFTCSDECPPSRV